MLLRHSTVPGAKLRPEPRRMPRGGATTTRISSSNIHAREGRVGEGTQMAVITNSWGCWGEPVKRNCGKSRTSCGCLHGPRQLEYLYLMVQSELGLRSPSCGRCPARIPFEVQEWETRVSSFWLNFCLLACLELSLSGTKRNDVAAELKRLIALAGLQPDARHAAREAFVLPDRCANAAAVLRKIALGLY